MTQPGAGRGPAGTTPGSVPGARHAGQLVEPKAPLLRLRYPERVYVNLYGFPDWVPYARAVVEVPEPPAGLGIDSVRVIDVLVANEMMAASGDPLWPGLDVAGAGRPGAISTPAGWVWAHIAMSHRLALVPAEVHSMFRHLGGVSTLTADRTRRGPRLVDASGPVPIVPENPEGVSEEKLTELETAIGAPLPPAYREFLMATDGARPLEPALHPGHGFVVDQPFFGIGRKDMLFTVEYANRWLTDRFTSDYVAVGYVQGGIIAVKVRGEAIGSVWYYDDDDRRDDDSFDAETVCRDLLHPVGDDFVQFWGGLVAVPEQLREVIRAAAASGRVRPVLERGMGSSLPRQHRPPA